jgi:hypothetical protein
VRSVRQLLAAVGSARALRKGFVVPHLPTNAAQDADRLGLLATQFRGTHTAAERAALARDYALVVERLIHSGGWHEVPPFEDQLPEEWMPRAFQEYWSRLAEGEELARSPSPAT